MEHNDDATSMAGRAEKPTELRKSASRTALPLTSWAVIAPAPSMAAVVDRFTTS
jgi:hypothetical protein